MCEPYTGLRLVFQITPSHPCFVARCSRHLPLTILHTVSYTCTLSDGHAFAALPFGKFTRKSPLAPTITNHYRHKSSTLGNLRIEVGIRSTSALVPEYAHAFQSTCVCRREEDLAGHNFEHVASPAAQRSDSDTCYMSQNLH